MAANPVVEVHDIQHNPQLFAELVEESQKGDGVCPAGDGHANAVAGLGQAGVAKVVEEAGVHRNIVYFRSLMNVFVIIPAAGLGTRMAVGGKTSARGQKKAKQFTEINGA